MRYILRDISVLVLLISAMLCSSCATIISGSTADIHIDGKVDEPLTVVTTHGEYQDLSLPATVKVKRRSLDGQHIQISSPSYAFSDIVLRKSVNPWSVLDAFLYGVPLVVDLMTNAASVPAQNRFYVTPDAPRSQADSLHRADSLRLVKRPKRSDRRSSLHVNCQSAITGMKYVAALDLGTVRPVMTETG
jgi:hypothetical protein